MYTYVGLTQDRYGGAAGDDRNSSEDDLGEDKAIRDPEERRADKVGVVIRIIRNPGRGRRMNGHDAAP